MRGHLLEVHSQRPLKVAFYMGVFPRISNTFIINQVTGLLDRGHEVDIFARTQGDFENMHADVTDYRLQERMKFIRIPRAHTRRVTKALYLLSRRFAWNQSTLRAFDLRRFGRNAGSLVQLYTTLSFLLHASNDYDIVHSQFGNGGPALLPLFSDGVLRGRLVTSFRGADVTRLLAEKPRLYDELLARGDLFLPVSDYFRERLVQLGFDPELTTVHRSGIDCGRFTFRVRRRGPDEATKVLFVGRLVEKKGVLYAVRAVAAAATERRNVKLTIVGDGEMRAEVEEEIDRLQLRPCVELLGSRNQAEIIRLMHDSHLLIAPSVTASDDDQEGVPNVLKEAMATGMPVLSTRHSGIPELVDDGKSGFLVAERNVTALAERLICLIDQPARWAPMGAAGRAKVEAEFDQDVLTDRLVELYREALGRSPRYLN